jgi:hypothetical protein
MGTLAPSTICCREYRAILIVFVTGDLFANHLQAQALANGCNCQGSMGAGIATGFRGRYAAMYEEYRRRCKVQPRPSRMFRWLGRFGMAFAPFPRKTQRFQRLPAETTEEPHS